MAPVPPSREASRLGGLRSAETRRRKAKLRADLLAKVKFEQAAERLAQVLIDAALGEGDFARLDPKDRVNFAVKALEYGVGRPRPLDTTSQEVEEPQRGISFTIGSPQGDLITVKEVEDAVRERGPASMDVGESSRDGPAVGS